MWDPLQPQDQGGNKILDWILDDLYIFLMMALLLELVESLVMIAPPTSPFVGATGQRKHLGD